MLAIVFDPHCWNHKRCGGSLARGINRRGQLTLSPIHAAVDVANEHNAELIIAGDLVDSAGPVQPQFAMALRTELARCKSGVHLMLGNHDMTADGDHSLGLYAGFTKLLTPGKAVRVRDEKTELYDEWLRPTACLVPFNCDIRDERVSNMPLLIGHFGVYDENFPLWLRQSNGAWDVDALFDFMAERNIEACLAGDWHQRNCWYKELGTGKRCHVEESEGRLMLTSAGIPYAPVGMGPDYSGPLIFQGGALSPTGFDNSGLHGYGTVALWDGETLRWQELPGPRFCLARSDAEEAAIVAEARRLGHNLFLRRFYKGQRPTTPDGLEAYEALPEAIESAARRKVAGWASSQAGMEGQHLQTLIGQWLEALKSDHECSDADAVELLIKEYT